MVLPERSFSRESWIRDSEWLSRLLVASSSLLVFGKIGGEFIEVSDQGEFSVMMELEPGTNLEETNRLTRMVEHRLSTLPEVKKLLVNVGASSEGFFNQSADNISELNVRLSPKERAGNIRMVCIPSFSRKGTSNL